MWIEIHGSILPAAAFTLGCIKKQMIHAQKVTLLYFTVNGGLNSWCIFPEYMFKKFGNLRQSAK